MSRKTVVIGAMKPMTAGHYALITKAVADSEVPAGENPANETYVLMSIQDRTRKGEMPIYGETALEALKDFYLPTKDFMRFDQNTKKVNLVFCHSTKFANENPERYSSLVDTGEKLVTQVEQGTSGVYAHIVDTSEFGKPENIADAAKGFFSDYESRNQGKIDPFEYAEIMKGIEAYGETGKVPNDAPGLVQKVLNIVSDLAKDSDPSGKRAFDKLLQYGKTINIQSN